MPTNRKQPFGYQMKNGEIVPHPHEADMVRRIFQQYAAGASYQSIVEFMKDSGVPYDTDKLLNKNMVARILENRKYLGESGYPQIIQSERFAAAQAMRNAKKMEPRATPACKTLRKLCRFTPTSEVERAVLYLLNELIRQPEKVCCPESVPAESERVKPLERELEPLLENSCGDESAAKALVMQLAQAQYQSLGNAEYETERMQQLLQSTPILPELNPQILNLTVSKIKKLSQNCIQIQLKNDQNFERRI